MILHRVRALALALLIGCAPLLVLIQAAPAMAQAVPDQAYRPDGVRVPTGATVIVGYDSGTGLPCTVGAVSSCVLQTSGSSGGGGASSLTPFTSNGRATLSATSSSSRVALATADSAIFAQNSGPAAAFCDLGDGTVTTGVTPKYYLAPGASQLLARGTAVDIACITGSGTAALDFMSGSGNPSPGFVPDGNPATVVGPDAPAAAPTHNPFLEGCVAKTTTPTVGTDGNLINGYCEKRGARVVQPYAIPENSVSGLTVAMTGTTSTAVTGMGAPGSALFNYITTITCGNSHATVGTFVDLQDGSGGTVFWTVPAAVNYGGAVIPLPFPLKQPTANTALYVKDQTSGANVICSAAGFKAP
jgi:hypothetical protein